MKAKLDIGGFIGKRCVRVSAFCSSIMLRHKDGSHDENEVDDHGVRRSC